MATVRPSTSYLPGLPGGPALCCPVRLPPMSAPCTDCIIECNEPECTEADADVEMTPECTDQCVVVACTDPVHAEGSPREVACDSPDCTVGYEEILQCCTDYHSYFSEPRVHAPDCMWTAAHDAMFRGTPASEPCAPEPGPSSQPAPATPAPMACMWDKCNTTFMSLADLVAHVNVHHLRLPPASSAPPKSPPREVIPNASWSPFNGQQADLVMPRPTSDFAMNTAEGNNILDALACHWGDCDVFPSPNSIPGSSAANDLDAARDILANHLLQDHLGLAQPPFFPQDPLSFRAPYPGGQYPYEPPAFIGNPSSFAPGYYPPVAPREPFGSMDRPSLPYPPAGYPRGHSFEHRTEYYHPRDQQRYLSSRHGYPADLYPPHHEPYQTLPPTRPHRASSRRGSESGSSVSGRSPSILPQSPFPEFDEHRHPSMPSSQLPPVAGLPPPRRSSVSTSNKNSLLPISRGSSSSSGSPSGNIPTSPAAPSPQEDGPTGATADSDLSQPPSHECSTSVHVCHWKDCTDTSYPTCEALTAHLAVAHVGVGKAHYDCFWGQCARNGDTGFTSKQKILRHLQSHTGHRPFQCATCKQNFSEAATLQQHMRRHTQEKPYLCDFPGCGKAFAITGALTIHKRTHNGHKPFKCSYCDRAFAESSNLSKHLRTHTGARPYACSEPACGKSFARPDQLTRHMGVHIKKTKLAQSAQPKPASSTEEESAHTGGRHQKTFLTTLMDESVTKAPSRTGEKDGFGSGSSGLFVF